MTLEINEVKFIQLQDSAGLRVGLSNKPAADFLGVKVRTVERWRSGQIEAPKAVIMCLESIIQGKPVNKLKVRHE